MNISSTNAEVVRDPLLEVKALEVKIGEGSRAVHALQGINFSVRNESRTGLVGESGSGKSLTALSILRALPETGHIVSGQVIYDGQDLARVSERELRQIRGQQISLVFQNARASLNPLFPVGQQIADVFQAHEHTDRRSAWRKAVDMLDAMGIPDAHQKARDYPHQYSGGMAQRAMVAMALVCSPRLLIADEPTTGLDVTIQAQVLEVITSVVDEISASLMLISHDLGIISAICSDVVVIYAGKIMESGPVETVMQAPANPYTLALISSFTVGKDRKISFIPGRVPGLTHVHTCCPFVSRCSLAEKRCREEVPMLREIGAGHLVACHLA